MTLVYVLKDGNSVAPEPGMIAVPWLLAHTTSAHTKSHPGEMMLCSTCITTCADLQGSRNNLSDITVPPLLKSPASRSQTLKYEPTDEDRVIKRIVATGGSSDKPPMAVAFLLGLCLQYSSTCLHMSDVRRLLLLVASEVQSAVWVSSGKVCKRGCWYIKIPASHASMQIKMGKKPRPADVI